MGTYRAPLEDMKFLVDEVLTVEQSLGSLPAYADYGVGPDLTTALLDEAARLAGEVLAPLRRVGGALTSKPPGADASGELE